MIDRRWTLITTIASIVLLLVTPTQDASGQEAAIRAVVDDYSRLLEEGDVDRFLDLFVDDPVFVHPMLPALVGKDALRAFVEQIFGQQSANGSTIRVERITLSEENWAYAVAEFSTTWVPNNGAEPFQDNDRYLFVLSRESDEVWKLKWCAFYERAR